jgi:hypothetical protein
MKHAAAFLVALTAVCVARADLAVPPPPGKKFARVDYTITTAKAYPDHEFYVVIGNFGDAKQVPFDPETPVKIDGNRRSGPFGAAKFVAVPKGAAAKFGGDKEFAAALRKGTVPGQASAKQAFLSTTNIDAKDPRTVVTETLAVEKIDAKSGIVLREVKSATSPAPTKGAGNAADPDTDGALATDAPRGGSVVAGLALTLALAFAGLWFVRRSRP